MHNTIQQMLSVDYYAVTLALRFYFKRKYIQNDPSEYSLQRGQTNCGRNNCFVSFIQIYLPPTDAIIGTLKLLAKHLKINDPPKADLVG